MVGDIRKVRQELFKVLVKKDSLFRFHSKRIHKIFGNFISKSDICKMIFFKDAEVKTLDAIKDDMIEIESA